MIMPQKGQKTRVLGMIALGTRARSWQTRNPFPGATMPQGGPGGAGPGLCAEFGRGRIPCGPERPCKVPQGMGWLDSAGEVLRWVLARGQVMGGEKSWL